MNLDFHYYGTYAAAVMAGFTPSDAELIAYSAQFVDEYYEQRAKSAGIANFTPTVAKIETLGDYAVEYKKDNLKHVEVWMPFHFLPSLDANYYKAPNSEVSDELLSLLTRPRGGELERPLLGRVALLPDTAPIREQLSALIGIGMICHTYADTFAHQDFAGFNSKILNNIYGKTDVVSIKIDAETVEGRYQQKKLGIFDSGERTSKGVFYLGHGTVGHMPDLSNLVFTYKPYWSHNPKEPDEEKAYTPYTRVNPEVFLQAFVYMRQYLFSLKRTLNDHSQLVTGYDKSLKTMFAFNGEPIALWKKFIKEEMHENLPMEYNPEKWIDQYKIFTVKQDAYLSMFDRHAKAQRDLVFRVCLQNGINIPSLVQ